MLYDNILDGIFHAKGLVNTKDIEKISFLQSLRPFATDLWYEFQKQEVNPDYSEEEKQDCYLLRYFPPYSELLSKELSSKLTDESLLLSQVKNKTFSVSFFGAGPAPELISLINFFNVLKDNSPKRLKVSLFDKNTAWNYSRDIVINHVIPNLWDTKYLAVDSYTTDFSLVPLWKETQNIQDAISQSNLVVFQNCLNEINNYQQVVSNIDHIINDLSNAALIVFIDQPLYKYTFSSKKLLDEIASLAIYLSKKNKVTFLKVEPKISFDCTKINSSLPEMVEGNLYYNNVSDIGMEQKLILRRRIDYSSLILERSITPEEAAISE